MGQGTDQRTAVFPTRRKNEKTNVEIIQRWRVQDGKVVIPGSRNPVRIKSDMDSFDFKVTGEKLKEIATLNHIYG